MQTDVQDRTDMQEDIGRKVRQAEDREREIDGQTQDSYLARKNTTTKHLMLS